MRPSLMRVFAAGFLGTVGTTLMMYYVTPLTTGAMDVGGMLGGLFGGSWIAGVIGHVVMGTIILPPVYALVFPSLGGPSAVRGLSCGLMLWLIAQAVIMPIVGGGFFSSAAGGTTTAINSLLGHVVYGVTLGYLGGGPQGIGHRREEIHREPKLRHAG